MDKLKRNPKLADVFTPEFNRAIITLLYRDKSFCIQYYAKLNAGYFESSIDKNLFSILHAFYYKHRRLPTKDESTNQISKQFWNGTQEALKTAHTEIVEAMFSEELPNKAYVSENVTEWVKKAEFNSLIYDSVHNFETVDVQEVKKKMQDICAISLEETDLGLNQSSFIDILMEDDNNDGAKLTSYKEIDRAFGGGLEAGELAMIIAPTSRGKTSLLINLCRGYLVSGCNVLHLSIEMSEKKTALKYLTCMADMTSEQLKDPGVIKKVNDSLEELKIYTHTNLKILDYPAHQKTLEDITAHLQLLKEHGFVPDILAVDYADILKPIGKYREVRHGLNEIFVGLRSLGKEHNMAVLTVSQTNRSGEKVDYNNDDTIGSIPKPLNLTHVAEDWMKVATADYVLGLRRPCSVEGMTDPNDKLMIIDVLKSRNAERDRAMYFKANWAKCTVDEAEPGEINMAELTTETKSKKKVE